MSKPRRDLHYLIDILEAGEHIAAYISDLYYEDFLESLMVQDAVLRNLQIIGEAVKRLSPELKAEHPDLPWREMAGLRDRIVHDYFGINHEIVWSVISEEIPALIPRIEAIADSEEQEADSSSMNSAESD